METRMLAMLAVGIFLFFSLGSSAEHGGVPGGGATDGWVDVEGDTMHGDLVLEADVIFKGDRGVVFDGGALRGGENLSFAGEEVCLAGASVDGCGTITAVVPGWGLSGGGVQGNVTLGVDPNRVQARILGVCNEGFYLQAVRVNGTVLCALDRDTTYGAAHGLGLDNGTFAVDPTQIQNRVTQVCGPGSFVRQITQNGTVECGSFAAGTGLILTNETFGVNTDEVQLRVRGSCGPQAYVRLIEKDGEVTCGIDQDTTYDAGSGLVLQGSTFSGDTTILQQRISDFCAEGFFIRGVTRGGTPICDEDQDTAYTIGEGLSLDGSSVSVDPTAIQRRIDSACADGFYMIAVDEDGTVTCGMDQDTLYGAGTGLLIDDGNRFILDSSYIQSLIRNTVRGGCPTGYFVYSIHGATARCRPETTYDAGTALNLDEENTFHVDTGVIRGLIRGSCSSGWVIYKMDGGSGRCRPMTRGFCSQGSFVAIVTHGSARCRGGWSTRGNPGTDPDADFIGTTDDTSLQFRVNDGRALLIKPGSVPNLIAGHAQNAVPEGRIGATIGGGGGDGRANTAFDDWATIGGGRANQAGHESTSVNRRSTTVAGGESNTAKGSFSAVGGGIGNTALESSGTVAGGQFNKASNSRSTVGGGSSNKASGSGSTVGGGTMNTAVRPSTTVGGGWSNTADGTYSTVPGGYENVAGGMYSFAAGRQAKADHHGAFVWRDSLSLGGDFHSTENNQFSVRAVGGVQFKTNYLLSTGCSLAAGGGSWSCTSDRDAKENWQEVDAQNVLDRLTGLPVATWNYHSQDEEVVHMGPAAQDFYAAFGLGDDEKSISQVDSAGVAFAAVQGLNEVVEDQAETIETLEQRLEHLEARLHALEGE